MAASGKSHQAHSPTVLTCGINVPTKDCGACHKKASGFLSATQAKHESVAGVRCHQNEHKTIPGCQQCHPQKHPVQSMNRFPKCGTCHYIAHDLNDWAEAESPAKKKGAATKKK